MNQLAILDYKAKYGAEFKRISYAWLELYFGVEEEDRMLLENHKAEIIDKGGAILFAQYEDKIVGTCALIKHSDDLFELAKMGVTTEYQGLKIGRRLAEAILEKAAALGAKKVFLESSGKLTAALALYDKLGFEPDDELGITPFSRCNVQLSIHL
jgi:N-acetylglutamate synthase-like GNAT family acetyltransferase